MAIYHQFTGNHSHALEVSEVPSGTWLPRAEFSACKNEKKPVCVFAPSNQRSMYTTTKLSNRLSCNGSSLTDIHVHVVKTSNTSMVLIGSQFVVPIHTCPCITHSTPHPLSPHLLTPSPLIPSLPHSLIPSLPHTHLHLFTPANVESAVRALLQIVPRPHTGTAVQPGHVSGRTVGHSTQEGG